MAIKSSFLDRLIKRLDLLDPNIVQGWILKLVREKGLLDTIFETIHEGVLIIDRDLKIHFVNNAAITLLGLPGDIRERENQSISRYLKDIDWEGLISQVPGGLRRASRQELEVYYPAHRYMQFYLIPNKNDLNEASDQGFTTIILHDVTEFRNKEKTTAEAEKIKTMTMLAAGVAHEIGNPLNNLNIHLQLLERCFNKQADNPEQNNAKELLTIALDEVTRLDTIINRFLKATRPTQLELRPVSPKELISDTINFMKKEIEDRGILVEGVWSKENPVVMGDETQLKQAFYNVIKNAIQAMPEGGLLKISMSEQPDAILFTFADEGMGIAPEELGNIFNPYYTTKENGTGLGLIIVERIIREHGGELGVESDLHQGTAVKITIPRIDKRMRMLESHPHTTVAQRSD